MIRLSPIIKRLIIVYGFIFIVFTSIFLLLFHIPFIQFQKIFFYKGLLFLALTTIVCSVGFILYASKSKKNIESLLAALMISIAINLSIFIVFPVTFERSVTIFLLTQLNDAFSNSCKGLTEKQMEQSLINIYIQKNNAVDKRLKEQEVIQTVEKKSQCVRLTKKGVQFLSFSRILSSLYNLRIPKHE